MNDNNPGVKTSFHPSRGRRSSHHEEGKRDYDTKVVEIKRVTRVVAGGKRMRFRALVVAGDKRGRVGVGLRKGTDVAEAVAKATNDAKKKMILVPITDSGSIPHQVHNKCKSAKVFLKPAPDGTGIIAGGPIRAVVSLAGIRNISSKMLGSANKISNVRAAFNALGSLKKMKESVKGAAPANSKSK